MKMKSLLLALTLISVAALTYHISDPASGSNRAIISGVPDHFQDPAPATPYSGLHPSQLQRPDDPFDYPIKLGEIGPVQPLFAGPNQYPFLCRTEQEGFGQPVPDNQEGFGIPVYAEDGQGQKTDILIGYSMDCLIPTRAFYYYNREGTQSFYPLEQADNDIAQTTVNGKKVDFIVRIEVGTINRFLYALIALKGPNETLAEPSNENWNKRLVYQFVGGVGIGRRQGRLKLDRLLNQHFKRLEQGYALVHSTANRTSNHYNIWLQEDTALRVKRQFTALYGEPLYTVGIGGSGGAIQQYLLAQNNPAIIDAAIPLYSYPDMITQTVYALDCELTEYLFDVSDADNDKWQVWEHRRWIQGLNAISGENGKYTYLTALSRLLKGRWPFIPAGQSECINGWRGLTPLVKNPHFVHFADNFSANVINKVKWTYWDDMKTIYGVNAQGYGRHTWDNVGVQYGLEALTKGYITPREFLAVNAKIGGWKPPEQMQHEQFSYLYHVAGANPLWFSIWGDHNMRKSPDDGRTPAPRTQGDLDAIKAAYRSGNVFLGKIDIPVIDLRHYLEPELDMHHAHASFSIRARMLQQQGHAGNQLIWMTRKPHTPIAQAFAVLDEWMLNIRKNPDAGVVANRPASAQDTCFDDMGEVIAAGPGVWDGYWNNKPDGTCTQVYPSYKNSRIIAGDSVAGMVFKCQLQSVDEAIAKGLYGSIDMTPYRQRLKEIFPAGVCDYSKPDKGRPAEL